MGKKQSGGVKVQGVDGTLRIDGDLVGRDKVEQYDFYSFQDGTLEKKNAFVFFIERVTTFFFTLLIGGIVLSIFIGGLGMLLSSALEIEELAYLGEGLALLMALGMAIANAASIKRYR